MAAGAHGCCHILSTPFALLVMARITNRDWTSIQEQILSLPDEEGKAVEDALDEIERDCLTKNYPYKDIYRSKRKIKVAGGKVEIIYEYTVPCAAIRIIKISWDKWFTLKQYIDFTPDI